MALPQVAAPANTNWAIVYTVPDPGAGKTIQAAVSINLAAIANCTAKIAITPTSGAPGNANLLEAGLLLSAGQSFERTGIMLPVGWRVQVQSSVASALAVQVYGIEEVV